MTILEDLMYKEFMTVDNTKTLEDAIKIMDKNHQGVVVAVDGKIPYGVITERDILHIIHQRIDQSKLIKEIFSFNPPITINKKRTIDYALHILIDHGIRRLVVVDDFGNFQGVVTQDILVRNLEGNSFKTDILISNLLDLNRKLITLPENETIYTAFDTMSKNKIGSIIATNTKGEAVGIFTEKDAVIIANRKTSTSLFISTVMSTPIISMRSNSAVKDVIEMMSKNKINRMIITDADTNRPINIVSMRDIAQNLKGNYGQLLESKLKNIKNTLNYVGEYIFEIYEDNGEQIIQWMNKKALKKFQNFLDKDITHLIEAKRWNEIYKSIHKEGQCKKDKIQIQDMYFAMNCSYHYSNKKETLLIVLQDITELENVINSEKSKNALLVSELNIVKSVIDQQKNIIFVTDGNTISLVNQPFLDFFDVASLNEFTTKFKSIENTFISHQNFFTPQESTQNWLTEIEKLYEKDKVISMIDRKNFEPKVFSIQLTKLPSDEKIFIVTFEDITEEKLESQKYYFNATHDALTKIYNKSFFLDSLLIALGKTKRYKSIFSLVMFNIDNLKEVNTQYGFFHGDVVVSEIAKTVDKHIRTCDVLARFSGDDFVIILPETNIYKAQLLGENLRKTIESLQFEEIKNQTASFGITQFLEIDNENTLLRRCEEALRLAKKNGKNQIVSL